VLQGTYVSAQEEAKKELKFLLVYLHDPVSDECHQFCREAMCHNDVIEFVNRNMLCWACSIRKPEGYRGTLRQCNFRGYTLRTGIRLMVNFLLQLAKL